MKKSNNYSIIILSEIKTNNKITQKELAIKLNVHERTIRRNFKILKEKGYIEYVVNGKDKKWKVLK